MVGLGPEGEAVVLAALLHDIGKVWQRTGAPLPTGYEAFEREDVGAHGAHARWSAACYQEIVPAAWRKGGHWVLTHHQPTEPMARIVAAADRIAASEREDAETDGDPRRARLRSIFGRIHLPGGATVPDADLPLVPLALERETLFPQRDLPPVQPVEYQRLWEAFFAAARGLAALTDFEAYLTSLLALLERYTWCVPSAAYRSVPDVSLYDHARVTAALAACLWQEYCRGELDDHRLAALLHERTAEGSDTSLFALIAGDLSGVQRFLYSIASAGAARTLRGRSLFLQLLSEAAADLVLRRLDLPLPNLLYTGGAKFYLLAPVSALEDLATIRRELAEIFLAIGGELYLVLDGIPLTPRQVSQEFSEAWERIGQKLQEGKMRRFAEIASTHQSALFGPVGMGGPVSAGDLCDVCGRILDEEEALISDGVLRCRDCRAALRPAHVPVKVCAVCRDEVRTGVRRDDQLFCARCDDFRQLGELLARAPRLFLTVSDGEPGDDAPEWQRTLARFGRWWDLDARPHPERRGARIWTINNLDFQRAGAHGFRLSSVTTPVIGPTDKPPAGLPENEPRAPGMLKSFHWLACAARGAPYLGVLRMDVDSLGTLFRAGLGTGTSPSRVASLSRSLRLFFEGWLGPLVREVDGVSATNRGTIAVIYAGGDDLFAVGPWDRMPVLAQRIRQDFHAFCAENPHLTISAGLVVDDPHAPLYQLAEDAKRALDDRAKEHARSDGRQKDALCFLGVTIGWEEAEAVFRDVEELAALVQGTGGVRPVPRALIHTLAQAAADRERSRRADRDPRPYYGRWLWLAQYQIHRLAERLDDPEARRRVLAFIDGVITPARIHTLGLVARWAEYLVREEVDHANH
jgi:CRISPR-associated protein Csm1